MNGKLTLNVESLSVSSFDTGEPLEVLGTVRAHEEYAACPSAGYPQSCATKHTCASFDISCRAE